MFEQHLCGAKPSPPDERDYFVKIVAPVALPVTHRQGIKENYNQTAGSCVVQTIRNIMRSAYDMEFGVNFMYGGARTHRTPGLYPSEAAKFLNKYGIAPARYDPGEREVTDVIDYYDANREQLEARAQPFSGVTYARAYTPEEVKTALYSGLYVAACFAISQYACKPNGVFPCTEARLGYHEMRVYGWDRVDGQEYACVQNSWGSSWAKNGECFVLWEDVFRAGDVLIFEPLENDHKKDDGKAIIRRTLKRGMRDTGVYTDVKELQEKLKASGNTPGFIDGRFGMMTHAAVKCFQRSRGLEDDGIVGKKTWAKLDEVKV